MFNPSTKFAAMAKVGAVDYTSANRSVNGCTTGVFGGGCSSCDARADKVSVVGRDGTLQVAPLGVQVGLGSAYPNQSGAAFGAAPDNSQGFNLDNNAVAGAQMDWVMTFTPNCPSRLKGLFIDPQIAPDLSVIAVYCGWTGFQKQVNLLSGRAGSNLANQNLIPGLLFAQFNQTIPGFQTIDAVFTDTAPVIVTGITGGANASITLAGAVIVEAV